MLNDDIIDLKRLREISSQSKFIKFKLHILTHSLRLSQ